MRCASANKFYTPVEFGCAVKVMLGLVDKLMPFLVAGKARYKVFVV